MTAIELSNGKLQEIPGTRRQALRLADEVFVGAIAQHDVRYVRVTKRVALEEMALDPPDSDPDRGWDVSFHVSSGRTSAFIDRAFDGSDPVTVHIEEKT